MPGYLTNPGTNAPSVTIIPISGLTSNTVQGALQELLNKNTSVDIKIDSKAVNVYLTPETRISELPSPTVGQVTYITSTSQIQVWNGSTWTAISGGSDINPLSVAGM